MTRLTPVLDCLSFPNACRYARHGSSQALVGPSTTEGRYDGTAHAAAAFCSKDVHS